MTAAGLIAEHGLAGVSVRDITGAAGVNIAGVSYHFGSKEALIEAIIDEQVSRIGVRRSELLQSERTLRDVVGAHVVATAELAADTQHSGRILLHCKHRLHGDPVALRLLERRFRPYTREYLRALTIVTPHLSEESRSLRWAMARETVDGAFSSDNYTAWVRKRTGHAPQHYTDEVIDFVVAGLAGRQKTTTVRATSPDSAVAIASSTWSRGTRAPISRSSSIRPRR